MKSKRIVKLEIPVNNLMAFLDILEAYCLGRFNFRNLRVRKLSGCKIESCYLRKIFLKDKYKNSQLKFDFYDENLENLVNINSI